MQKYILTTGPRLSIASMEHMGPFLRLSGVSKIFADRFPARIF